MGMQKGYISNINVIGGKIGPDRRQEILDGIADPGTYLPRGVSMEDMDQTVIDHITSSKDLSVVIDGQKVPVIFLTIQRWSEFTKTWSFTDEYKNIEMPFITIVRKPDVQQGQNQAGLWNIPDNGTYPYFKVPTWDGVRRGVTLYKIPQPTPVDITYEVRIFTNRMKDLNEFNTQIQIAFQSRQEYINVKGHPMPLHLESIGDESRVDDLENRRFYVQMFELMLLGYILNEKDYEIVPTINRTLLTLELDEEKIFKDVIFEPLTEGKQVVYNFTFKPKSALEFTFTAQYDASFTQLTNISNISRIIISVNGSSVFDGTILTTPLVFLANDSVKIRVYKNLLTTGQFTLIGSTV